jgi:hypothetical protein
VSERDERTSPARGYVLDDLALVAGLVGSAGEHHRRGLAWLIDDAVNGGPLLDVPALCLTEATTARRSIGEHVADLVASAPPGAVAVREFVRDAGLDSVRTTDGSLDWASIHAALHAIATRQPVVTLHPERYKAFAIETMAL